MKVQLLSDLHLEFKGSPPLKSFLAEADVLVLAGDIGTGRNNVLKFLKFFAAHYPQVIYVPGNHEYYNGLGINDFNEHKEFGVNLPNHVHFLNPGTVIYKDVTFIGATLWTNFGGDDLAMKIAKSYITDFRRARITPDDMVEAYNYHEAYIKSMYHQMPGKKVIVTHFLPARACIDLKYLNTTDTIALKLNHYFANNLDDWILSCDDLTWLYGHTHSRAQQTLGTTRLVSNPLGYPGENAEPYHPVILEI